MNTVEGSGRRAKGGTAGSPIGTASWRGAPTSDIDYLTNRTGHVVARTGSALRRSPLFGGRCTPILIARPAGHKLPQPFAVIPPRPAAGHVAARHRAEGPAHPDGGIHVHDPDADDRDRRRRMDDGGQPLLIDGEVR